MCDGAQWAFIGAGMQAGRKKGCYGEKGEPKTRNPKLVFDPFFFAHPQRVVKGDRQGS